MVKQEMLQQEMNTRNTCHNYKEAYGRQESYLNTV